VTKSVDISGVRFGYLVAIRKSEKKSNAGAIWICKCDCGNETEVLSLKLRKGLSRSCGCKKSELISDAVKKHGLSNKSLTYRTWKEMRQRCNNPNSDKWKWYGGRGISIDERWNNFELFLFDMGERQKGTTLDRIDPDGNYCKNNCRWATSKQQAETNRGLFKKGSNPWNKNT